MGFVASALTLRGNEVFLFDELFMFCLKGIQSLRGIYIEYKEQAQVKVFPNKETVPGNWRQQRGQVQ